MQRAGSESWRFAEGVEELSHAALFVRDAVGLTPSAAADIPPRLTGQPPDRKAVLDAAAREEASLQWPRWWRAVLRWEACAQQGLTTGRAPWRDQLSAVADPPDFANLADSPALQGAVQATFSEACRWAGERRRDVLPADDPALFGSRLARDTAEEVAASRGVRLGIVQGCAVVLMVEGIWWARIGPGAVACSVASVHDPQTARSVLRAAFESGVTS
jgi:hypothetical protein